MKIYGVAMLAFCFLAGKLAGHLLGASIDINGDVGGVGFAMILLMVVNTYFRNKGWLPVETESGILFWTSMYIPIVIAMAATQHVKAALAGGPLAILVGTIVTLTGFMLVPLISRIGKKKEEKVHSLR
jgi:malonate transporter MadL subunit